ncbi:MAG: CHAT domain-containing protein [Cyanobacteria bacterium P01_F01_bin.143]
MDNSIKVLFISSDPSNAGRLRFGQETRDIREKLQLSKHRNKFFLETRESIRPSDLTQAIFDVNPQFVHFSGHGTKNGNICFEDISGIVQPVSPEALATLFSLFSDRIKCVILNACYSEDQARAISKHIPFVIGMKKAISDEAAIVFSVGFYKALGAGESVERAYEFGCVEIQLNNISEHLTPVLYKLETGYSTQSCVDKSFECEKVFLHIGFRSAEREGSLQKIKLFGVPGIKLRDGNYEVTEKIQSFFDDLIARSIFRNSRRLSGCDFKYLKIWLYDMDEKDENKGYEIPQIGRRDVVMHSDFTTSKLERIYILDKKLTGREYARWKNTAENLFTPLFATFITSPETPDIIPDIFKNNPLTKIAEEIAETVDPYIKMKQVLPFNALIIQID